jgi:hypothetical protein
MSDSAIGRRGARRSSGLVRANALEASPIGVFVDALLFELELDDAPAHLRAKRLIRRLAEFATSEGMALDREIVFDPDTIERFCSIALAGEQSVSTYRAVLRSIAPKVTRRAPWEPRPQAFPRRMLAPPYSVGELETLACDIAEQPTARRRRAGQAMMALGLGAGLDGRWVTKVVAADVRSDGGVVLIRVGEPNPRSVPVRALYEAAVVELAEGAGDSALVGGHSNSKNRTGHLVASFLVPTGHVPLAPARLRSTWLLAHLIDAVPLGELCVAAGLAGPAVLGDLFEFLPLLSPDHHAAALRGGRR